MNATQIEDVRGYVAYVKENPENAYELIAVTEDLLDYIDLLHEDLRITRNERDAEKHKNLVVKQELHLHKTQMREARAIAAQALRDAAEDLAQKLHEPGCNWGTRANDAGHLLALADLQEARA